MATNDEFQMPTGASKVTRSVLLVIRAVRLFTAACLIVGAVYLFFLFGAVHLLVLFTLLFDSPKSSSSLVLVIIISVPLSFFLSAEPYKKSLAQGYLTKAILFGTAPLLLIGGYVGIGLAVDKLTPDPNAHADATIEGAEHGELFIKTPEKCRPSIFRKSYSIDGTWKSDGEKITFTCDGKSFGMDSIIIKDARSIPYVESELMRYTKLVETDGNSESYKFIEGERIVAEITTFTAYDGHQAFVRRWTASSTPTHRWVSRRLDDTFELAYGIDQKKVNGTDIVEADKQIAEYVKSIVRRNK